MHPAKFAFIATACLWQTACGSIQQLENKAVCTLNSDRAMVVSMWSLFGIATDLRNADTAYICPPRPPALPASAPANPITR